LQAGPFDVHSRAITDLQYNPAAIPMNDSPDHPNSAPAPVTDKPVRNEPSLTDRATAGFAWTAVNTVLSKGLALITQITLAWWLLPEHFGLAAQVYAAGVFGSLFIQNGQRELLLRRQQKFELWASPSFWISLTTGLLALAVSVATAPLAAWYFKSSLVGWGTVIVGFWWLSTALGIVPNTRIERDLRFKLYSVLGVGAALVVLVLSLTMAAMGAGMFSIIVPIVAGNLLRTVAVWLIVRPKIRPHPHFSRWKYLLGDSAFVFVGMSCTFLTYWSDYLILGRVFDDDIVGYYFFALNLSVQTVLLLAFNLQTVLMPALTKLKDDPPRQHNAYVQAVKLVLLIGMPLAIVQAVVAEPLIQTIFPPRWIPAILLVQILCTGAAFRIATWPSQTMVLSQGRFRTFFVTNLVLYPIFLSAVALGAMGPGGSIYRAATYVAIYYLIEALVVSGVASFPMRAMLRDSFRLFAVPVSASAISAACALGAMWLIPETRFRGPAQVATGVVVMLSVYTAVVRTIAPEDFARLMDRVKLLMTRVRARGTKLAGGPK
jgi:O-antigen/teichoic acid export membrane protein